jgi:hypothetical protein
MSNSRWDAILEKLESVDQKVRIAVSLIRDRPDLFCCQGSVQTTWRSYRGRRLGPYFRLSFRVDGQQRSLYLGADQKTAAIVREALAAAQQHHHERLSLARCRQAVRSALRETRRQFNDELASVGLHLKGTEIRGWRTTSQAWNLDGTKEEAPSDGDNS